jgi:hypothetical protein
MHRLMNALATLYQRWRYVEEDFVRPSIPNAHAPDSEPLRTRRAIEREERLLADYKRNGCATLALECETSLRAHRKHLAALEL